MRVVTFNIRGGLGMDGRRSTLRIAETVLALSADIVCFQEVHQRLPWSGWIDQPRQLRRALGMRLVFQRNLVFGLGGYGVAIASRLPLLETRRHFLPSVGERRGALKVSVGTPTGPVSVWCTHWGLHQEERLRQAVQLARWVSQERQTAIICGDFNERSGAPAVRALLSGTGLRDAGADLDLATYPADLPTARIDFLLSSPTLTPHTCAVADTQVSDHRPVLADFL